MTFDGKVVIVTGGSQNIGLAICEAFLSRGARVVSADLNAPDTDQIIFHKTDVANEESITALMSRVAEEFGRLDVLVNNAGICAETSIREMSVDDWDRIMNINVRGVFLMTKHAYELMANGISTSPAIVNISSIEGLGANPLHAAYAASKGAVASFSKNTALEFGPAGIRCNAIAPGWINTPFNEALLNQYPDRAKVDAEISALHPLGKLGTAENIAETAAWLASEGAAFINGQLLIADGGRLAKLPTPNL